MIPERRRLTYALLLSLLIHAWLLRLTFVGHGFGLPGFAFPWQDRRIEAPDLRVVLVPPPAAAIEPAAAPAAEPPLQARIEQPAATLAPPVSRAPSVVRLAPEVVSAAKPKAEPNPRTAAVTRAAAAKAPSRADQPRQTAPPPSPAPAVIALERSDEDTWVVPPAPATLPPIIAPATLPPIIAPAPSIPIAETPIPRLPDAGDAAPARTDQEASQGAVDSGKSDPSSQQEPRTVEQLQAAQQGSTRAEAMQVKNERLEAERQEAERQEAARQEAARQEAARQEAARQEAARQEAARQEAARQEAARQEAARQEAARQEAARQEAARQDAARAGAQEAAARREERLRAIGRQLDEEAAQRQAAMPSARLSPSLPPPEWRPARRYRLFGRTDPNEDIILYAEAWERKIQLNMTFDEVRDAVKQPHTDPIVKVAIRSDGSVESVTFVLSSGVPAIDDAIRRVVDSQKPYRVFPPSLAREWDVIEIRRTWHFDTAIRLY